MKGSFNYNFYITAATVIPVLYLALTLQSSTNFRGSSFMGLIERWRESEANDSGRSYAAIQIRKFFTALPAVLASLAILWSIFNEFYCFYALYKRKSNSLMDLLVLISIGCVLIIITAGPFLVFLGTWIKSTLKSNRDHFHRFFYRTHKSSQQTAPPESQSGSPSPG
jgi:hypothetical protein